MNANNPVPTWPAWGHDKRWAWRLECMDPLLSTTEDYLLRGDMLAVRLIDSDLRLFKVVEVRKIGLAGAFGWRPGFKGKHLRVQPVLQLDRVLSLEAAKQYVIGFISANPAVYESGMPIDELTLAIASSGSPQALLELL